MPKLEPGTHNCTVKDAKIIQHRFNDSAYMVLLDCVREIGGEECHGEVTLGLDPYASIQGGKNQGRAESEVSFETLAFLGIPNSGKAIGKVKTLVGKKVEIYATEPNDKGYSRYYVNMREPEIEVDAATAEAAVLAMLGQEGAAPAPKQKDPFGGAPVNAGASDESPF